MALANGTHIALQVEIDGNDLISPTNAKIAPVPKVVRGNCYYHIDENRDVYRGIFKEMNTNEFDHIKMLIYGAWGDSREHYKNFTAEEHINHYYSLIKYLLNDPEDK